MFKFEIQQTAPISRALGVYYDENKAHEMAKTLNEKYKDCKFVVIRYNA